MIEVLNISVLVLRRSTKSLFQAFAVILFFASIFLLLGKQLYKGVLTQKCVLLPPYNISQTDYVTFTSNSSNWLEDKNGHYLCGNGTGARRCPPEYICLKGEDANSVYASNFDFYGSSVVTIAQLMTLHFWQEIYQKMLLTVGSLHVTYFVLAFYMFLYLNALILAIITRSYKVVMMELNASDKTATLVVKDNVNKHLAKGIVKSPSCKSYELFVCHIKQVTKNETGIIEEGENLTINDSIHDVSQALSEGPPSISQQHKSSDAQSSSTLNFGIFHSFGSSVKKYRKKMHKLLSSSYLDSFFLLSIIINSLIIVFYYSAMNPDFDSFAEIAYYVFTLLSVIEVLLKIIAFGLCEYLHSKWNAFDFIVTFATGIEIFISCNHNILLFLRVFKLATVLQKTSSTTCKYLIGATCSIIGILTHPLVVLVVFITICIVSGMQLYGIEYFHNRERFPDQQSPRWFFQDCYSSFLLVFCMLCGDWKQPMVNAIFFTSYASNLLMLIFVLIGNLVVMNLFPGLVFYTVYYNDIISNCPKDNERKGVINAVLNRLKGKEFDEQEVIPETKHRVTIEKEVVEKALPTSASQEVINKNMGKDVSLKGSRKNIGANKINKEFEIIEDVPSEYMADCCPNLFPSCCSILKPIKNPVLWQMCTDMRCRLYCLVEAKLFRIIIGTIIITSVVTLIVEATYSEGYPVVIKIVQIMEPTIMMLFIMEMFLKWTAYGLQRYFKSPLGRLEFVIILVYLADLLTIQFFEGQKNIFKSLRSFRLLSVIQFFSSYQEVPPLPLKRTNSEHRSENASRESLLHLKKIECDHFLLRHFSEIPTRCSHHAFVQGMVVQSGEKHESVRASSTPKKWSKKSHFKKLPVPTKGAKVPVVEIHDCLPSFCYNFCPCCNESVDSLIMSKWKSLRTRATNLVISVYFSGFVMFIVSLSSLFLILEVINVIRKPIIMQITFYVDKMFAAIFVFIALLRMLAIGWKSYFTQLWFWIEFVITTSLLLYVILKEVGIADIPALKIIRVVLLLYISKALGFNKQAKILQVALRQAIPSYVIALVLCLLFWVVYAVFGVFLFEGKFQYCAISTSIENEPEELKIQQYDSKDNCFLQNGTVKTRTVNFDNLANAYVALLQTATLQNWLSLVTEIMDNTSPAESLKYQIYTSLFFPSFIMLSTYLSLNFFAGMTIFFINKLKKESKQKYIDETEKLYHSALKTMKQIKLHKSIPEPQLQFQKFVFRMVRSDNFEFAGFVFIGLHMLLIALDMYEHHPTEMFALAMIELNVFFIIIFMVESILKLVAMRHYFFIKLWNLFDVFVLALCILGALFEKKILVSPMLPAMLRVLRFVKAPRYLRRHARGVLPLIRTLYRSIPTTASICGLQLLVMCIYAIAGVYLFQNVKQKWDVSEELNFETFTQSMLLLFQLSTLAGWENVVQSLSEGLTCPSELENNNCNNRILSVMYVVSYLFIMYYIIVKTHYVVVLENYERSMEELENILLYEDYKMFTEIWQKFDPHANGIIELNKLADLLDMMEEPFHFDRPNRFLIVSLNVPIYEGELVYYSDVMDSLTRDFMARNGHIIELPQKNSKLLDKSGRMLKKVSSTLWRQRQNHCANVIQHAWKRYIGKLGQKRCCVFYSEVRLACHSDRVDTILASSYPFSSHASV